MFLQVSVCPVGGGWGVHPLGRHPLPETATAADGTHPTGMHSLMFVVYSLFYIACSIFSAFAWCEQALTFDDIVPWKTMKTDSTTIKARVLHGEVFRENKGPFTLGVNVWAFKNNRSNGNVMGWRNRLKFSGKTNRLKISLIFSRAVVNSIAL